MGFEDKVVFITGGAAGIGCASASALADRGASVVIADVDAEAARRMAKELELQGLSAFAVPTDVGDRSSIEDGIQRAIDHFGGIDILINNAARHSDQVQRAVFAPGCPRGRHETRTRPRERGRR
jgi:NAD(P)-dependent dehydrogenase (short-subunit alcohol dehydrogenase family)